MSAKLLALLWLGRGVCRPPHSRAGRRRRGGCRQRWLVDLPAAQQGLTVGQRCLRLGQPLSQLSILLQDLTQPRSQLSICRKMPTQQLVHKEEGVLNCANI